MFNFSQSSQGAGTVRLQLEALSVPPIQNEVREVPPVISEYKSEIRPGSDAQSIKRVAAGMAGLAIGAFCLRFIPNNNHTAYMDEVSQILAGRYLIEQGTIYANILRWSYGSYLWPLVAGSMDILGGLQMVRAFTALCGVIMTLATAVSAYRLAARTFPVRLSQFVALGAGLFMAILPTGLGIGSFGTYDSLAGAAFMTGIALLFPVEGRARRSRLVAAFLLLFVAFLSKYIIAIYFPVICLYLIFSAGSVRNAVSRVVWFVGPLAVISAGYFAIFQSDLLTLLSFSHNYTDLRSDDPFLVYVWERPEIWVMVGIASFGWKYATSLNKLVALGGVSVILAFQLATRSDYDFWKHSIYLIFFVAPLAALAVVSFIDRFTLENQFNNSFRTGRNKIRLAALGAVAVSGSGVILMTSLVQAGLLVNFYPNLGPALPAIRQNILNSKEVLTDDLALRYYLYPEIPTEQVTDPFYVRYQAKTGLDAYKAGISDRFYDTIILDGGIGPVAQEVNKAITPLIKQYYSQVASIDGPHGSHVEIYKPQQCVITTPAPGSKVFNFAGDIQGWGGRSNQGNFKAGNQVSLSQGQSCNNLSSLKFTPTLQVPQVAVHLGLPVKSVKAQVYIETKPGFTGSSVIGMAAFDQNWQWHDDGFKQLISSRRWVEISWQLPDLGYYNEFDLVFPKEVTSVYISQVEVGQ